MNTYAMTGGATGIGAAIKSRLQREGHKVIVVDIKDADIIADLATTEGRQAAISAIRDDAREGLDGFVACAGLGSHVPNHALIAKVNYFGATELIMGLKDLLAIKKGSVILISSNSAPMETSEEYVNLLLENNEEKACKVADEIEGQMAYSGSKQAIARWMRRNTASYAADGVRMNAVAPGYTETPMTEQVAKDPSYGDAIKAFLDSIPIGRAGVPEDMAKAVSFLLGPDASFICGAVLFVDGGHDAMMRADQF